MIDVEAIHKAREWGLLRNLSGKHVAITGKLSLTRADMEELISALGGVVDARVTLVTNMLLVPDGGAATSIKAVHAYKIGVATITESAFITDHVLPTESELLAGAWAVPPF